MKTIHEESNNFYKQFHLRLNRCTRPNSLIKLNILGNLPRHLFMVQRSVRQQSLPLDQKINKDESVMNG